MKKKGEQVGCCCSLHTWRLLKATGTGVLSSSARAAVAQGLPEDALGSASAATISARTEMNIPDTLVNCSQKSVRGRGKRRGRWGCLFLLLQWKAGDWELLKCL